MIFNLFGKNQPVEVERVDPVITSGDIGGGSSNINNMTMDEFGDWVRGINQAAGVTVNSKTAMRVSAVYACVALIGGAIASLPLQVYERKDGERKRIDHDVWWLMNREPNPNYSAAVFRESLTGSLLLRGDGFSRIMRPSRLSPNVSGFDWYTNDEVVPKKVNGQIVYALTRDGKTEVVTADDMIHVPGPGFDGLNGMSQIRYVLTRSAGIALAADEYSAKFFENGARPDFALEWPTNLTPEQQEMVRNSWAERFQGLTNRHLPALLTGGAKVHELTMNAEDAQLISTRQFQVEDIARIFGVPPHMIGHTEKSTSWGTGVEQMSIGFVKYTLQRHLVKIEQELNRKLFGSQRKYFVEFNTAGLERGDYKTRMEGYRIALGRAGEQPWMDVDEVRKLENLPKSNGKLKPNSGQTNDSTAQTAGAE